MKSWLLTKPRLSGLLILLLGVLLAAGGTWLLLLGGSAYYLLAGLGLCLTGGLLMKGRRLALWVYGVVWLGSVIWAFWEVGPDVWKLEPRLMLPTLLGLYLLLPFIRRRLDGTSRVSGAGYVVIPLVAAALVGGLFFAHPYPPDQTLAAVAPGGQVTTNASGVAEGDWNFYGRTAEGERWSPLAQITPDNVTRLQEAWTYRTGDLPRGDENKHGYEFNFEATPIKVGDTLYFCTPHREVIALDPDTGEQRWRFDPRADTSNNAYLACRGVAYYKAPEGTATACPERIISSVGDARIMALNARTGALCQDFGKGGYVSLRQYLGEVPKGFHFVTSPPLVIHDRVVLGGWIYDGQKTNEPSGAVRAFNPINGEIVWAWDVGHPDDPVVHPTPDQTFTRGTPNAWGVYTADVARGILYLPTGNAVPDYYGAERRPFDEKYSSSLVALDVGTGAPRWSFQTLHHDLWDMDVPIGPSLVDLPGGDGQPIPALVQTTKRGELFMLNRVTGEPIARVEEKPAPQGGLPEEHVAPTQPYSTGMPTFAPPEIKESDTWGVSPLDQLLCRIEFRQMNYKGAFTPFELDKTTLVYPAFDGVIDWHGASIDPERQRLYANLSYIPFKAEVYGRADAEREGLVEPWDGQGTPPRPKKFAINPQYGTPYVVKVDPWLGLLGAPCKAPPWGQLAAVDLKSRTLAWQHDVGTTRDMGPLGLHMAPPFPTGMFNIGGQINTRSGLIFMGATADNYLRAFSAASGKELWKTRLPAGGQATPMTYTGRDGRQYVVIAAGGHGGLGTKSGDYIKAYALPKDRQ